MNRHFLAYMIIFACFCFTISECYAWPPPPVISSDWKVYAPVGTTASVDAWVVSGGAVDDWEWDWPYGFYDVGQDDGPFDSTSWGKHNTAGSYTVDVEATNVSGSDEASTYVYIFDVEIQDNPPDRDTPEYICYGTGTNIYYKIEPTSDWSPYWVKLYIKDGTTTIRTQTLSNSVGEQTAYWNGQDSEEQWVEPKEYTAEIEVRKSGKNCSDNHSITVVEAALDISGVDDDDELDPGGYVGLNGDREIISLSIEPDSLSSGTVKLDITSGTSKIEVWDALTGGNKVIPDGQNYYKTWTVGSQPGSLYVEGINASDSLRDVELRLSFTKDSTTCDDKVKFTVIDVEIDTPSSFPAYVALGDNLPLDCTPLGATGGTYSWSKVTGPGTVTFSDPNAKNPTFSANQSGNYTVKVEYTKEGATAYDTSGTITVYSVDTVIWETYPGNTNLGYPCPNNGGRFIFPGKKTYDDAGAADRKKVRVKATITPVLDNKYVYFSWWDVDDPSTDDSPIDTNGSTGNDNRGSGESLSATSAVTDGSGEARVTFTVSMNPGDNFKIAASCSESKLSEMTQQMADSGNPPDSVVLSEMLTVWRKLWIEKDSMDAVASSGAEKNYISGTASRYELISPAPKKTRVYLGQNLPSEMDDEDQYDMGVYKVPGKSPYLVHYSSSRSWPLEDYIDVVGDLISDGASKDYDLYDDDYHPITLQPHVTLPSYPDLGSYADEFRRAYIEPNYLSDSDVVSFDRNMGLGDSGWNDQFDNPPSSGFWSALSVAAYQPITSKDGDPEVDDWLGEAHMTRNDLALYLEVILHEAGMSSPNKAMAHEIGHTGGLEHCSDPTCIMYEDASYNFCDDCLAEMRGKGSSW